MARISLEFNLLLGEGPDTRFQPIGKKLELKHLIKDQAYQRILIKCVLVPDELIITSPVKKRIKKHFHSMFRLARSPTMSDHKHLALVAKYQKIITANHEVI